jgi:hypothetical protein
MASLRARASNAHIALFSALRAPAVQPDRRHAADFAGIACACALISLSPPQTRNLLGAVAEARAVSHLDGGAPLRGSNPTNGTAGGP